MWPRGVNFNRSFPGRPDGPPNEQLADYFDARSLPRPTRDRHALRRAHGARSSRARTCTSSTTRRSARRCSRDAGVEQRLPLPLHRRRRARACCRSRPSGRARSSITTELGGGGLVTRDVHELAWSGLANVLRHAGVLEGEVETRASMGKPDAVILDGRDPRNYCFAADGRDLREAGRVGAVGRRRRAGRPASTRSSTPSASPRPSRRRSTRVVVGIRAISWTEAGRQRLRLRAVPIEASELL